MPVPLSGICRHEEKSRRRNLRLNFQKFRLSAVVANGFDRAAFLGFLATRFLVRIFRLLIDEGVTAVIVPFEIIRRGLAAQVAIDALIIYVIFAGDILRIFVRDVCHKAILSFAQYESGFGEWQVDLEKFRDSGLSLARCRP